MGTTFTVDDFHRFHRVDLPERIAAGNGALAWADLRTLGTLAFRVGDGAYTYMPADGTVEVVEGDAADTVVELAPEDFAGLTADLDTAPGLLYGGRASVPAGKPLRFLRWEPGLRALYHGRPIFDPDRAELLDADGGPLDPTASFTMADVAERPGALRRFMDAAGYVVVRSVFDDDEVGAFRSAAAELETRADPEDGGSWWGTDRSGAEVVTRNLDGAELPVLAALYGDARLDAVVAAATEGLGATRTTGRDAVTVLWKRPAIARGLSDLPWHRDCGMGGHAINCPTAVMSICIDGGEPGSGDLRVLPGSQHASFPFVDGTDVRAPEGVRLDVRPGDLSLHLSDVMHVSLPPEGDRTGRVSILLAYEPATHGHHLDGRHYNDAVLDGDGRVGHLADRLGG